MPWIKKTYPYLTLIIKIQSMYLYPKALNLNLILGPCYTRIKALKYWGQINQYLSYFEAQVGPKAFRWPPNA